MHVAVTIIIISYDRIVIIGWRIFAKGNQKVMQCISLSHLFLAAYYTKKALELFLVFARVK